MHATTGLAVTALLLLTPAAALAQPQSAAQQRCIVETNAGAAALARAQGRAASACLIAALHDRLPAGQTAQSCLTADARGKVAKARANLVLAQSSYCASLPDFGFDVADVVAEAVIDQSLDTYARIFGDSLDAAILSATADPARARCQGAVARTMAKMEQLQYRAFQACKSAGLRSVAITSAEGLEACVGAIEGDAFRVVGKLAVKLADTMEEACPQLSLASAFPGRCASAADFTDCVRQTLLCGVCLTLNRSDDLYAYCDQIDDGAANASCVDARRCGNAVVEPGEECDDGNHASGDCCTPACLREAIGSPCASDSNACTDDRCSAAGTCAHTPNSAACDDASFCNGTDQCSAGSCSVHSGDPCTAGSECNDQCHGAGHCFTSSGTPCTDDGSECTGDACDGAGSCVHDALAAGTACTSDGNPCTHDVCDGNGACAHPSMPAGSACTDDGNPCTADLCDAAGNCLHTNLAAGSACGDPQSTSCSAPDTCDGAGSCRVNHAAAGSGCDDDFNVCTTDVCDGAGACQHHDNSVPCSDGRFCNGADTCAGGSCSIHAGSPCAGADGDGNCAESCNEAADNCLGADPDGSACTDGIFCNGADTCVGGSCTVHVGNPCPGADGDGNCSESCNEAADACISPDPNGASCNDGVFCNGADTCSGGVCSVHAGNPCSGVDGDGDCSETCDEQGDTCGADPDGSACSDGIFCNGTDTCDDGFCQSHAGDPCAGPDGDGDCSEQCDESADACTAPDPDGAECNDGQGCNGLDNCLAGQCTGSGVCCGTVDFAFTITSSTGGAFTAATWPGGTVSQSSTGGCTVTIRRPSGRIDTVGSTGDNFGVTDFSGFAGCVGFGGEDGDGCQPLTCPPAGIGQCASTRPSCSAALNGSGSARYTVRCTDP
ncbi:MAG TPA: hypothetical protein VEC57_03930 [Candidatus Limnocylindrales bacterium]|nr:hypothetical protein [Candidatus Limnocylindrales bacterium]